MGRLDDGITFLAELTNAFQHAHLISIIQICRGLVHEEDSGLLCQCPCDQHQLTFTTGDVQEHPIPQIADIDLLQRGFDVGHFLLSRGGEARHQRRGTHQHHIRNGIIERRRGGLRNIGHLPGELFGRQRANIRAVNADAPAEPRQQTEHTFEQRALAHAVRPQQTDEVAGFNLKADLSEHRRALRIGIGEIADLDTHYQSPRLESR